MELADLEDEHEAMVDRGWTDGLPVVPPTPERVLRIFLASEAFADAARLQGEALGFPAPYVLVPHPVQDRTDDELRATAERIYPDVVAALTA